EPGDDVADGEGFGVTRVEVARGIREHVQLVEPRAAVVLLHRLEELVALPDGLPLRLDHRGVVCRHLRMVARVSARAEMPVRATPQAASRRVVSAVSGTLPGQKLARPNRGTSAGTSNDRTRKESRSTP